MGVFQLGAVSKWIHADEGCSTCGVRTSDDRVSERGHGAMRHSVNRQAQHFHFAVIRHVSSHCSQKIRESYLHRSPPLSRVLRKSERNLLTLYLRVACFVT